MKPEWAKTPRGRTAHIIHPRYPLWFICGTRRGDEHPVVPGDAPRCPKCQQEAAEIAKWWREASL